MSCCDLESPHAHCHGCGEACPPGELEASGFCSTNCEYHVDRSERVAVETASAEDLDWPGRAGCTWTRCSECGELAACGSGGDGSICLPYYREEVS